MGLKHRFDKYAQEDAWYADRRPITSSETYIRRMKPVDPPKNAMMYFAFFELVSLLNKLRISSHSLQLGTSIDSFVNRFNR